MTARAPHEPTPDADFESLLLYLQEQRGADFTGYKRPSLTRLVTRRMRALGVETFSEYTDKLMVESDELPALLDALLINVTALFRDPATWAELADNLLPAALDKLAPSEPIRCWSAACASGEEAYTLAMVLHQLLGDETYKARVKIYATDIDEDALSRARAGRFTTTALAPLTEEQRATYFEPDGDAFRFRADLRQSLIFGRHDLQQDAPISRVLLLTCRNALMYFTAETQSRVLERFPFALHEHGLLVLGKAEMLLTHSALFVPVSLPHRIFRARRVAMASRLASLAIGGPGRDLHLRRVTEAAFNAAPDPQVVVDAGGTVTLLNERAERELRLARSDLGRAFNTLELSYRPLELRGAVAAVQASGEAVEIRDIEWPGAAPPTRWDIRIAPLVDEGDVLGVQLTFTDVTEQHELRDRLEHLHRELSTAYEELQSSSEELETTNEELQSAEEELETSNEELHSTNEELETMNEELQSTNEELQTLNDELRDRTLQVDEANSFLQGILEGLTQAVVVVDGDYRVQLWNQGAERLTGQRAFEVEGLLLLDTALEMPLDELHALMRRSIVEGKENEISTELTNRFGKNIRRTVSAVPLRRDNGRPRGAVISILDTA
ncbi:MAG: cheR [Frankiales bacterium]|nr:cheR [Frankiales bacterium]